MVLTFCCDLDTFIQHLAGWDMKVCVVMAVAQLLLWVICAGVTHHPSHWKLVGGGCSWWPCNAPRNI